MGFRRITNSKGDKEDIEFFLSIKEEMIAYLDEAYNYLETEQYFLRENNRILSLNEGAIKDKVDALKYKINKHQDNMDEKYKNMIKQQSDEYRNELRNKYVKDEPTKISKILKTCLKGGAVSLLNVGLGAAYAIFKIVNHGKVKREEQDKLLSEIKFEIEICEEKIRDCGPDERDKKYKLMRIKNELEKAREKIIRE